MAKGAFHPRFCNNPQAARYMYVSHALTNKASWSDIVDPKLNLQLEAGISVVFSITGPYQSNAPYRLRSSCTLIQTRKQSLESIPNPKNPRCINCHPTIMPAQVVSPFSTYRLFRDPCRTFPSLDPFHQLYPITCTCSTCSCSACIMSQRIFSRVGRGDPTRAVDGPIAELRPYALFGELSHPRVESSNF